MLGAEVIRRFLEGQRSRHASDLVMVEWNPHEAETQELSAHRRHCGASNSTIIMLTEMEQAARELHAALITGELMTPVRPVTLFNFDQKLVRVRFGRKLLMGLTRQGNLPIVVVLRYSQMPVQ